MLGLFFFFQAEDGIRDAQESRGLGDVYKRQPVALAQNQTDTVWVNKPLDLNLMAKAIDIDINIICLLYTSDAADDLLCVDLGGRRIIKKKTKTSYTLSLTYI